VRYLLAEDILHIHSMIIDETGGMHGVRNHHVILSLENSPRQIVFGKELYPTIFLKAAIYVRDIIMSHPFIDGNKRTGIICATVFLEDNGYTFTIPEGGIEEFTLRIVEEKLDPESISTWLNKYSRKIKSK